MSISSKQFLDTLLSNIQKDHGLRTPAEAVRYFNGILSFGWKMAGYRISYDQDNMIRATCDNVNYMEVPYDDLTTPRRFIEAQKKIRNNSDVLNINFDHFIE